MAKYIKKPIPIEATQWFKHGDHLNVQVRGNIPEHWNHKCEKCGHYTDEHGDIKTLEGKGGAQEVCPGDYIITGVQGENYPCKPDIFEATYDLVQPEISDCCKKHFLMNEDGSLKYSSIENIPSSLHGFCPTCHKEWCG